MGLPKHNRLQHRHDFAIIYKKGQRWSTPHLTLRAVRLNTASSTPEAELLPIQIGISVSKKVSKRAVVRNRIKRWLRAIFRQLLPVLTRGWQVVVVVHPQAVGCGYHDFLQELEQLLVDAEVIYGHSRGRIL